MLKKIITYLHRYPQSVRFLVAGCYNTAVGYALFLLLYALFYPALHYMAILVISHFISVSNAYFSMRYIVFQDYNGGSWSAYIRCQISYLAILGLNASIVYGAVEWAHVPIPVAPIIATGLCVVISYLMHRFFTFKTK